MKMATDEEIKELQRDFEQFKTLGNSIMKSAYLASSGRGFIDVIKTEKDSILLKRDLDNYHVFLTTKDQIIEPIEPKKERICLFHNNTDIFKK